MLDELRKKTKDFSGSFLFWIHGQAFKARFSRVEFVFQGKPLVGRKQIKWRRSCLCLLPQVKKKFVLNKHNPSSAVEIASRNKHPGIVSFLVHWASLWCADCGFEMPEKCLLDTSIMGVLCFFSSDAEEQQKLRFQVELEFVQCLANPNYLNCE